MFLSLTIVYASGELTSQSTPRKREVLPRIPALRRHSSIRRRHDSRSVDQCLDTSIKQATGEAASKTYIRHQPLSNPMRPSTKRINHPFIILHPISFNHSHLTPFPPHLSPSRAHLHVLTVFHLQGMKVAAELIGEPRSTNQREAILSIQQQQKQIRDTNTSTFHVLQRTGDVLHGRILIRGSHDSEAEGQREEVLVGDVGLRIDETPSVHCCSRVGTG